MEVRNGKKMNFKRIYSQIAKYGRTIPELAEEYGMEEEEFIERIQMGLEQKLFLSALSASEKHLKQRKACVKSDCSKITENTQVERKDITELKKENEKNAISRLESRRSNLVRNISDEEKKLDTVSESLIMREKVVEEHENEVNEKKKELEVAIKELTKLKNGREKMKESVERQSRKVEELRQELENVENQIYELKNKDAYLVVPNFTGTRPEYGTFYSTVMIEGFTKLSVVEVPEDYYLKPNLDEMIAAGYDSYKEYTEALQFVMLCMKFECEGMEYNILGNDERIKKLLEIVIQ